MHIVCIKGIQQYVFLLFHLEELLKLYVNLFYRFWVTLLFLEIFEQKKSQPRPQGLPRGGARAEEDPGDLSHAQ